MDNLWLILLYSVLGMLCVFFAWRVKRLKQELKELEEKKKEKESENKYDE